GRSPNAGVARSSSVSRHIHEPNCNYPVCGGEMDITQEFTGPFACKGCKIANRALSFPQTVANQFAQPRAFWISRQSVQRSNVLRKAVDKIRQLANDCRQRQHQRAAKRRLHRNVLAIVLANKLARIAWSVLAHGRAFEARPTMTPAV